jgi:glycosyltransferase involved in cell wall biosynthesis
VNDQSHRAEWNVDDLVDEHRVLPLPLRRFRQRVRADAPPQAAPPAACRVCLYTPSVDPSGMGAHMLDLAAEYLPGVEVSVMCWPTAPGRRVLDRAATLGASTLALPHPRDPAFANSIVAFLQDHPADVFHVHVGTGREDFDGARAARRAGVPTVVQTLHLPWLLRSRGKRRPFFRSLHEVDRLLAVSQAQARTYNRIGVPSELITTVPNGVGARTPGLGRRAARERLGLDPDQPVVMTVGRLTVMKGQRHLVDAVPGLVARFPELVVLVFGQGHLHARLTAQAEALGVGGAVRLLGHRSDARALLDAADVFVLPSRHEGMPLVALEAMEAGLPVVTTRVIGSEEVVADGETGLLVPPEDPAALSAALAALLADPGLRARMGQAGRRRYRAHFTRERMAAQTLTVYDQALQAAGAAPLGGRR